MSYDLAEWLLARIAEDKAAAVAFRDADGIWGRNIDTPEAIRIVHAFEGGPASVERVLAECDAKRRIVEMHAEASYEAEDGPDVHYCRICSDGYSSFWDEPRPDSWPCGTLKLLALPYADRPGYREEWRP